MIVKMFKGKGNAKSSADYLIGKKNDRELAIEIKGDLRLTQTIAEQADFSHQVTVGCLSFEEPDLPMNDKLEIIDKFEDNFFNGLEKEDYSIAWVEHTDKGRLELNFYIANVELSTEKRLVPYFHKADLPMKDSFQTVVNYEYGLSNPLDPRKTKALQQDKSLNLTAKEHQNSIHEVVREYVDSGDIQDRSTLLEVIEESGYEVARVTKNSISIKNPDGGRNIRLKGAVYSEEFYSGEYAAKLESLDGKEEKRRNGISREDYQRCNERLKQTSDRRAEINRTKYKKSERSIEPISATIRKEELLRDQRIKGSITEELGSPRRNHEQEDQKSINVEIPYSRDLSYIYDVEPDNTDNNNALRVLQDEENNGNYTEIRSFRIELSKQAESLRKDRRGSRGNHVAVGVGESITRDHEERENSGIHDRRESGRLLHNWNDPRSGVQREQRAEIHEDLLQEQIRKEDELSRRDKADIFGEPADNRAFEERESNLKRAIKFIKEKSSGFRERISEWFETTRTSISDHQIRESDLSISTAENERIADHSQQRSQYIDESEQAITITNREIERIEKHIENQLSVKNVVDHSDEWDLEM